MGAVAGGRRIFIPAHSLACSSLDHDVVAHTALDALFKRIGLEVYEVLVGNGGVGTAIPRAKICVA
jgi:hypothetical protein